MDKPIVVVYMNFNIIGGELESVINNLDNALKERGIIGLYMNTTEEERVECINPKVVSESEYEQVRSLVEEINTYAKEITKKE